MSARAETYGQALYELARDEGLSSQILEELGMAVNIFRENPDFTRLLALPSVPKAERCGLLDESFGGRVHEYLLSFLKLLVENGLIRELAACGKAYRRRFNADNGIVEVTATTAVPLTPQLARDLCRKLSEATGKKIDLVQRVDKGLIGGVRLEMNGRRYDGSVKSHLEEIRRSLDAAVL